MRLRTAPLAFALAIVLAVACAKASAPALAQAGAWFDGDLQQQRFFSALRTLNLSDDQRATIRGIVGDGYLSGQSDRDIDMRVIGVLTGDQAQTLRDRLGGDFFASSGGGYGYAPTRRPDYVGVVHKINGGAITLDGGRTAFLRDSTILIPSRDAIKPGARIAIQGARIDNGNLNADLVQVLDGPGDSGYGGFPGGAGGGIGGVIERTTNSNILLQNGRTVFLRDDTVVRPSRDAFRQGARIVIYGVVIENGNINADRVDVVDAN